MGVLDDIMPVDKSDAAPITEHLRGLLQELRRAGADLPRITITLDADAWAALELQFRRPFRPHSSYKYLPLDVGVVAFERRRDEPEKQPAPPNGPSPAQLAEGYIEMKCRHCGITTSGFRLTWCVGCGKGYFGTITTPTSAPVNFLGEAAPALTPEAAAAFGAARAHAAAWTPDAIEAKAAQLEGERAVSLAGISATGQRPSDAIYTTLMAGPISEGNGTAKVDVAGYGGPWKEPTR